jgi:uncharacterized protein DUF3592
MFGLVAGECRRQTRQGGPAAALLFALFWSLVIGLACVVVVRGAVRQVVSAGWPAVDGTVTVSEPEDQRGDSWKLAYEYVVAGRLFTGTVYAFDPMPIQGGEEVLRHIAAYPVGAAVDVYYNPHDRAEAVLRPGLRGCTLWIAMFLSCFVLIGLGMWLGLARALWYRPAFDPADPRQVATIETGAIVVRPERVFWPVTFLTYFGFAAAVVSWTLGFVGFRLGAAYWLFDGSLLDPPVAVPASIWAVLLIGCALATWRTLRRPPVLTLDTVDKVLRFRRAGEPVEVAFATSADVSVKEQSYWRKQASVSRYRVDVAHGGRDAPLTVAEYDDPRDAQALAEWLRHQLDDRPGAG